MKQLQKYYAENPMSLAIDDIGPYYDASEADAAFAEMRREHAEEIEVLDGEIYQLGEACQILRDENEALRKQAERYEKLRKLNARQSASLYGIQGDPFDALVDQLPASGQAPAPRKGSYGQECNRTACHQSPATWHNRETLRYYCEPCGKLINHNNRSLNPPLCAPTCSTCTKPLREIRTDPWGPVIGHRFCDCAASPDEQAGRVE